MSDKFEQPNQQERISEVPDITSQLFDAIRGDDPARQLNVASETEKITTLLGHGTDPEYLERGVNLLSTDLKTLSNDIPKYNQLLKSVSENIWDEPVSNPAMHLSDFNHKTGTWDKVTVNTYVLDEGNKDQAYRIVQPGNTLGQIARDLKNDVNTDPNRTTADYLQYLQEINGITDANKIQVGQAIKLHKTRAAN